MRCERVSVFGWTLQPPKPVERLVSRLTGVGFPSPSSTIRAQLYLDHHRRLPPSRKHHASRKMQVTTIPRWTSTALKTVAELIRGVVSTMGGPAAGLVGRLVARLAQAPEQRKNAPAESGRGMGRMLCQQQPVAPSSP